ncbi:MAG: acyl-CoA thioesterase [Planctomycetaceae bacterium]|nr:acyl-CoA thioesterase [Planctomycetaceae bacterium]
MASFLRTTRRVEFCETDMAGIVHFSNFYKWMEQAEHDFFRMLGLTIVNHQSDGSTIGWPRVSASCRFESPAHYDDVLDVFLSVQRIGVKSLTYNVEFSCGGRPVARGSMKSVSCTVRPGQPLQSVEIPEEYLAKIHEYSPEDEQSS